MNTTKSPQADISKNIAPLIQQILASKRVFVLALVTLIGYFVLQYLDKKKEASTIEYDTALIQEQIKNVGKLVVTEGHFSQVMTYKDEQKYLMDLIHFDKKALVVINADVAVSFDLSKVKYAIDTVNKIVTITNIPEEEIKISPDIKYYNVAQSTFNEFTGDDYNKINKIARENLQKKIDASTLKSNAKNRLVSELSKILIVTSTMGWKLKYNGEVMSNQTNIQKFFN